MKSYLKWGNDHNIFVPLSWLYICQPLNVDSCGTRCFYLLLRTPDRPSRFFGFELVSRGCSMQGKLSGRIILLLTNSLYSWVELLYVIANWRKTRERQARSPRAWYTWAGTAIVRREATCWSVLLAWKKTTLSRFPWITGKLPRSYCTARFYHWVTTFHKYIFVTFAGDWLKITAWIRH